MVHALSGLDGGRAVKVGVLLNMPPTLHTREYIKKKHGPRRRRIVSINERHHHFTVEFDFPEGSFRETYKEE